jgi:hypothetical protein
MGAPVHHLPEVKPVLEQMRQWADAEADAAARYPAKDAKEMGSDLCPSTTKGH